MMTAMHDRDERGRLLPGHRYRFTEGLDPRRNATGAGQFTVENHPRPHGEQNPGWHGDQATYNGLHQRVRRERGRAAERVCEHCGGQADEWATIHGKPGTDPHEDYLPLCKACHIDYDDKRILSPDQVADIRARRAAGERSADLAAEYGVFYTTINKIARRSS